ncbi:MAG: Uma2 family endonuclease [Pleurocapsa sp.]
MVALSLKSLTEKITDEVLEQLCRENPEAKLETNAQGQLIVMSPTGSQSGKFNLSLSSQVWYWNSQTLLGVAFDSSTGFKLSNGAVRSPDVSWIAIAKWNALTDKQKRGFAPIDPDFVIELMSPTDEILELQQKMSEYMACGVRLGWLINPDEKQVEIYRQGQDKQLLSSPISLSGEDFLPGLTVDLAEIFA